MSSVEGMATEVRAILEGYTDEISENVQTEVDYVTDQCLKKIQDDSPKKTKKYSRSWKKKVTEKTIFKKRNIIHNLKYYRLTHLLENGHALRTGGRARSYPHIKKNELWAAEELVKRTEEVVKRAGH